jgi:hypothetical protein
MPTRKRKEKAEARPQKNPDIPPKYRQKQIPKEAQNP